MLFVNTNESALGSVMDYEDYIECHEENAIEAGSRIVIEAEQNWNRIMKAVGIEEVRAYAEGSEVITEGAIGDFLQKAKEFFQNLWKKVVGLFKKFISLFDQAAQKDKDFVKKYRTDVLKKMADLKDKDLEIKMHKGLETLGNHTSTAKANLYEKINEAAGFNPGSTSAEDIMKVAEDTTKTEKIEKWDDHADDLRGKVLNQSSASESEFRKELKEMIYGDAEDVKIDAASLSNAFSNIEGSANAKKTLKTTFKGIDDSLKSVIKKVEALQKTTNKITTEDTPEQGISKAKKITTIEKCVTIMKSAQTIMTSVYTMECQAIKDRNRECRAMVAKVYRTSVKKESAFEEGASTGSAFAGVTLI